MAYMIETPTLEGQEREDARNSQWRWVHNLLELHKKQLDDNLVDWRRHLAMYRGKPIRGPGDDTRPQTIDDFYLDAGEADDTPYTTTNLLFALVDQSKAQLVPPKPTATVRARRKPFQEAAEYRTKLVDEVFELEDFSMTLELLCALAIVYPRAFLRIKWDRKNQRPELVAIPAPFVFYDTMARRWDKLRYIAEVTVLTRGEFMARVRTENNPKGKYNLTPEMLRRVNFGRCREWLDLMDPDGALGRTYESGRNVMAYQWTVVYEFYDLVGKRLMHFADGVDTPLYEGALPYHLVENPFFKLTFNDNLTDGSGLSDAALVENTLERLDDMLTLRMQYLQANIPRIVVHKGLVADTDSFVNQLANWTGPADILELDAPPHVALDDVLGATATPHLLPDWDKTIDQLMTTAELILAVSGFMRGQVGESNHATEVVVAEGASNTRGARRQLRLNGAQSWAAKNIIRLFMEKMPEDSSIPVMMNDTDTAEVGRAMFGFGPLVNGKPEDDDPWDYNYKLSTHGRPEENAITRYKHLMELLPTLVQNPDINQRRLMKSLLEIVGLLDVLNTEDEAQAIQEAQAAAAAAEAGEAGGEASPSAVDDTDPVALANPQLNGGQLPEGEIPDAQASGEAMSLG